MSYPRGSPSEDFVKLLSDNLTRISTELGDMREANARELGAITNEVKRIEKIEKAVDEIQSRQQWLMIKVASIGAAAGLAVSALWKKIFG